MGCGNGEASERAFATASILEQSREVVVEVAALSAKFEAAPPPSQLQMREVVTEVAASTANIELPLWKAATVDGLGVGKMNTRTTEDENLTKTH